jgi:hypothetical protein
MFVIRLIRFEKDVIADFTVRLSNGGIGMGRPKKHGWSGFGGPET